jgi:hypothetical protein
MPGTLLALSPDQIAALEKRVEEELFRKALDQGVMAKREDLIVRDLLPSDINGVSGEIWVQHCSADAYNTVFSGQLANPDRVIAIYGMADGFYTHVSAAITGGQGAALPPGKTIKFGLGANAAVIKDIWDISRMRASRKEVFASTPIYYNKGDRYTIQIKGDKNGVEHVILYGKICEAKGTTIQGE